MDEATATMIRNLAEKTGKNLDQWVGIAKGRSSRSSRSRVWATATQTWSHILQKEARRRPRVRVTTSWSQKAYVSLRRSKQFGFIQPSTTARLDIGITLKGVPAAGRLEASGSWNAMVTHRIRVESKGGIDAELIGWLRKAYDAG